MNVGAELKRARLALGLTVLEVGHATRLRANIVDALENNDFAACGGEVFARGHVRSVAMALNLDPVPLLESMGAITAPTVLEALEPESLSIWQLKERAYRPSERRLWALILGIGLIIVIVLVWRANASADPVLDAADLPAVTSSATATVTPEPTPTTTPEPTQTATPAASQETATATPPQETDAAATTGALVITLECTQTSWVRITNDLGTVYEGTMRAGMTRVFASDSDATVRIGNAAGVSLIVNDELFGNLGAPGEVYRHTFHVA
mgnify:CR=1 FL=1